MSVAWKLSTSVHLPRYPKRWYLSNVTTGLRGEAPKRASSRLQQLSSDENLRFEPTDKQLTVESPRFGASNEVLVWSSSMSLPVGREISHYDKQEHPLASNQTIAKENRATLVTSKSAITTTISPTLQTLPSSLASTPLSAVTSTPETFVSLTEESVSSLSPAVAKAITRRQQEWAKNGVSSKQTKGFSLRSLLRFSMLFIMSASLVVMASVVLPDLYYRLNPESTDEVIRISPEGLDAEIAAIDPVAPPSTESPLPPVDVTLPEGSWLLIPSIGVNTQLAATADPNEALTKGAWLVPDFGRPNDTSLPIIAAAHRFGWDWWWQSDFGRKNSFYSLPSLENGDTIEIVYDQRKYIYSVYAMEEGQEINDYTADLILYTCKYFNSPERYFTYAKRDFVAEASAVNENVGGSPSDNSLELASSAEDF